MHEHYVMVLRLHLEPTKSSQDAIVQRTSTQQGQKVIVFVSHKGSFFFTKSFQIRLKLIDIQWVSLIERW